MVRGNYWTDINVSLSAVVSQLVPVIAIVSAEAIIGVIVVTIVIAIILRLNERPTVRTGRRTTD